MRASRLTALILMFSLNGAMAQELQVVGDVELQPLAAGARRVAEALEMIGQPLTPWAYNYLNRLILSRFWKRYGLDAMTRSQLLPISWRRFRNIELLAQLAQRDI